MRRVGAGRGARSPSPRGTRMSSSAVPTRAGPWPIVHAASVACRLWPRDDRPDRRRCGGRRGAGRRRPTRAAAPRSGGRARPRCARRRPRRSSSSTRRVGCGRVGDRDRARLEGGRGIRDGPRSETSARGGATARRRAHAGRASRARRVGRDVEARDEVADGVGHGRRIVVDAARPTRRRRRCAARPAIARSTVASRPAPVARDAALVDAGALAEREVTGEVGHPTSLDSDG